MQEVSRTIVDEVLDLSGFDTTLLLKPFLAVIRSSSTTGAITSLALNSISKFFSYRLINRGSPRLPEAMKNLSSAVTHCRFEASDSGQQDEVVLLRILMLMQEMMSGIGGDLLSDESVCEMMETGLSMCCQMRLSEMLRRSAEMTMLKMVQVVFTRLKELDPNIDDYVSASTAQTPMPSPKLAPIASPSQSRHNIGEDSSTESTSQKVSGESITNGTPGEAIVPYGITSIRELLRVLISILNPSQRQHTDSMRVMALRIIEVALEVGGLAIAERPSLRKLATDDLCRYLFQLIRSDNHVVLQSSLRVVSTMLHTMRIHLKLQQELFLNYVVACLVPRPEALRESGIDPSVYEALPTVQKIRQLSSGRSTPVPVKDRQRLGLEGGARGADAREVMIECIGSLVRIPTFMIDLFVNYDCDENLSDLCEDVLGFLCRNAFPDAAIWSTTNVPPLCLDALLGYISLLDSRLISSNVQPSDTMPDPDKLNQSRRRKELVVKAAAKFNEDPKTGIHFMKDNAVIDIDNETASLAKFLFSSGRINKRLLGDFISKPKNLTLLQAFVRLFDFANKRLDEALRELLQKFRLPGESQQISRIVEEFASIYFTAGTTDIKTSDAAYVLSYAIIMLNTDQHNPQANRSRMTSVDFAKNLRGTNDGENFPPEYLQEVYDEIKNNEIIMPEEHDTSASFEYAWKELLGRMASTGPLVVCETTVYDEAMFRATWQPLVATLTFVFQSASDDAVFSRVIGGLSQCARIASHYGVTEVMDQIVSSLAKLTLLAAEEIPSIQNNTTVEVDSQKVTVSELGIAFGREFKAQLAMVILFRICNGNENTIREGWTYMFDIFSSLLVNSLLPTDFSPLQKFMKISPIPLPPPNRSSKTVQRGQESSFFSSLSSYLTSYSSDDVAQPTSEQIESTMCTFDCVSSCRLNLVADNLMSLNLESTEALISTLIQVHDDSPAKKAVSSLLVLSSNPGQMPPVYDPSTLLRIEIATALALKDQEHTKLFGPRVLDRLKSIIQQASQNHTLMTERALAYLLRLYQATLEVDSVSPSTMIQDLAALDDAILQRTAVPIAYGLLGCLRVDSAIPQIASSTETFDLVSKINMHPDAASLIFEIVSLLSSAVSSDNYESMIKILDGFASAGQVGAEDERQALLAKKQAQARPTKSQIPPKPSSPHKEEIQRACRAVEILYQLRHETADISRQSGELRRYWSLLLKSLRDQCLNPCKEVSKYAFTHLQRLLLSLDLSSGSPEITVVFDDTIITFLEMLQDPTRSISKANEDNKVQTASLLCKVWLHHLSSMKIDESSTDQWVRVLTSLINLMSNGRSPYLNEAVTESIKNVLLVMASSEMMVEGSAIFQRTSTVLADAKLDLMNELFPPQQGQAVDNDGHEPAVVAEKSDVEANQTDVK